MTLACDCDGTLLDSERVVKEVFLGILAEIGHPMDDDLYDTFIGSPDHDIRYLLANGMDQQSLDRLYVLFNQVMDRSVIPLKSGVVELLDYGRSIGHHLVLATSSSRRHVDRYLPMDVIARFDLILTRESVTRRKPDPEIYRRAQTAFPDQRLVVLEDSPHGIKSAVEAGAVCYLIPDLAPCNSECRATCAGVFAVRELIGRLPPP